MSRTERELKRICTSPCEKCETKCKGQHIRKCARYNEWFKKAWTEIRKLIRGVPI